MNIFATVGIFDILLYIYGKIQQIKDIDCCGTGVHIHPIFAPWRHYHKCPTVI